MEAHAERLCFVLLDVTMPGISGGEFLALMDTLQTDVPVILSSGHMRNDVLANIPSARLVGYLQKPYLLNDLSTAVDIALASRSGADATPIQRQPPPQ